MHAEVTATFKKDLPQDTQQILVARLGQSALVQECAAHTTLAPLKSIVAQVSFAKLSNSAARLYFRDEARVLKIHIESVVPQNLKAIRREIADSISEMRRLGRSEKSSLKDIRAIISTAEGDLQEAYTLTFGKRFMASATENIPTKIYVPVVTFVATLILNSGAADVNRAFFNALVAVLATLLWVVIDTVAFKPSIKYSEI